MAREYADELLNAYNMNIKIIVDKHAPEQVKVIQYGHMSRGIMTTLDIWKESRYVLRENI